MLLEGLPHDDDIIKVDQAAGPLYSGQDHVHQALEGGRCITQPKSASSTDEVQSAKPFRTARVSRVVSMRGRGQASFRATAFTLR